MTTHPVGRLLGNHPIYGKLHSPVADSQEDGGHDSGLEEDLYEWLPRGTAKDLVLKLYDTCVWATAHESKLTCVSHCSGNSLTQNLPQTSEHFSSAAIVTLSAF